MQSLGVAVMAASGALVVGVAVTRARLSTRPGDLVLAVGGAGLAVGGLLVLGDVAPSGWLIAPPVAAALTVLHVRLLTAPGGPMRT